MTLKQAQDYVRDYQVALNNHSDRGRRKNPSLLPTNREQVVQAFKLEIANLYYINCATDERIKTLINAVMFIDTFTRDALDSLDFIEGMRSRKREVYEFYLELLNIDRRDPFYWQRVYALAGIACETKSTTFFETLKERLRQLRQPADQPDPTDSPQRPNAKNLRRYAMD